MAVFRSCNLIAHKCREVISLSTPSKFQRAVLAKEGGRFIEEIPATRKKNYWRDGVRQINEKIFFAIMNKSDLDITHGEVGSESKCEYSEGDTLSI